MRLLCVKLRLDKLINNNKILDFFFGKTAQQSKILGTIENSKDKRTYEYFQGLYIYFFSIDHTLFDKIYSYI